MASIHYVGHGKAPYVDLTADDRLAISEAIEQVRFRGMPMNKLAQQLGVNRTYFYTLFNVHRIELMRLAKLQAVLSVQILEQEEIDKFLDSLRDLMTVEPAPVAT